MANFTFLLRYTPLQASMQLPRVRLQEEGEGLAIQQLIWRLSSFCSMSLRLKRVASFAEMGSLTFRSTSLKAVCTQKALCWVE